MEKDKMTEEEKKAITNLIDQVKFWKKNNIENSDDEILLNLIDKQQEEIEKHEENELILCMDIEKQKEKVKQQQKEIEILELINNYLDIANKDYISKDKIREKIKDLKENDNGDDYSLTNVIMILKELLEE